VEPHHALGVPGLGAELHDRDRGRIGSQELGVGQHGVEPSEQLPLGVLVLHDRLDGDVRALEVVEPRRVRDPLAGHAPVVLGQLARADGPIERALDGGPRALQAGVVGFDDRHVEIGARADLRDPRAHQASAYHSYSHAREPSALP
jgi:hypothetical protein